MTGDGRFLPEHEVKALMRDRGIPVPRGIVTDLAGLSAATTLRPPLALKAFGPRIVHKTELGAVALGLDPDRLADAAVAMAARVEAAGADVAGFLVEEQCEAGPEILLGAIAPPSGIPHVAVGLGGTWTEVLDAVTIRLWPLDEEAVEEMLDEFRGADILRGDRGGPPLDRVALRELILAVGGRGGLVEELLPRGLTELECNPVIVHERGVTVADARLRLGDRPSDPAPVHRSRDLEPLFRPRSIAVCGASARRRNLATQALEAYRAAGWDDHLYAVHPTATEVAGVPAVPTVSALPEPVDYLKVAVAADQVPGILREAAGRVEVAQILTGGFGELGGGRGEEGEAELLELGRESGVTLVGPNCLGAYCPEGRQTFQLAAPREAGGVGIVSQSGGLASDLVLTGAARGLRFSRVLSVGNAIDLTPAETLEHLLDDPHTNLIGLYLEGFGDGARLLSALRRARGRKPVVILMGGVSEVGARSIASHTGALAGDLRLLEALCRDTGAVRVETLEDLIGALTLLQRYPAELDGADGGVLVLGSGGGSSTLAAEAAERAGLALARISPELAARLAELDLGVPKEIENPLETIMSPTTPTDAIAGVLAAAAELQPFRDVLVHFSLATFFGLAEDGTDPLREQVENLAAFGGARVALVARNTDAAPGAALEALRRAANEARLPLYPNFAEAMTAIGGARRFDRVRASVGSAG